MEFRSRISMILVVVGLGQGACAHSLAGLRSGTDLKSVEMADLARKIPRGGIVVIGENHGQSVHQSQQLEVLRALRTEGHKVSVGLEFFQYPFQELVDEWRAGSLPEADFLKKIDWGQPSFSYYRSQAEFPLLAEGAVTLALNAPRSLTSKISKNGWGSLSEEDLRLLPPQFSSGRDSYRKRFLAVMSPHLPDPAMGERYFLAQSVWDDTMAWKACEGVRRNPDQTLVIVVGEFHVQYGGGLPNRLRGRCPEKDVTTLSQVNLAGLSDSEVVRELSPSLEEGPRADWIWAESLVLSR